MNAQRPQFSYEPDPAERPVSGDVPCPVCTIRPALLIEQTGVFVPCAPCLSDGWELVRWRTPWGRWRARYRSYRPDDYRRPRTLRRVR